MLGPNKHLLSKNTNTTPSEKRSIATWCLFVFISEELIKTPLKLIKNPVKSIKNPVELINPPGLIKSPFGDEQAPGKTSTFQKK